MFDGVYLRWFRWRCSNGIISSAFYCGRRTVLPLILRLLSISLEEVFPYDPHWKMSDCHLAFWRDSASCDHRIPVARFGTSKQDNLVTSCYMCNSMKQNWTVEELGWKVNKVSPGETWDGLPNSFPMLLKTCADRFENAGIPYFQDWLGSVQATAEPAVLAGKACE